jgi:phage terminase small subunit
VSTALKDLKFDADALCKKLELTDKQRAFADYYIFLTGLDAEKAVVLAGYEINYVDKKFKDPEEAEQIRKIQLKRQARSLLNNPKIIQYIKAVRENLEEQLLVDKIWVIQKLKTIVP